MSSPRQTSESKRRPSPPDYSSRRVQIRLLFLVCLFMLVIVLMEEARKPKYYRWMWGGEQPGGEELDADADTRLPPQPNPPDPPAGSVQTPTTREIDLESLRSAAERQHDVAGQTAIDAWATVTTAFDPNQRRRLNVALLCSREARRMTPSQQRELSPVVDLLSSEWQRYLANARRSLDDEKAELSDDQRQAWREVLNKLEEDWERRWKSALESMFLERDRSEDERAALTELQGYLDELAIASVKDNTVLRPGEKDAWFRLLEQLNKSDPDQLRSASTGVVGFLQLFKQPKDYRGKLVTVRGQVRLGYHVRTPRNAYGIDGYYILWLKPRVGPNSPLVVYCLETPGLPPIKDKDIDGETTPLHHDVEITGYFFKNWAYRAKDGINTAPLVLAKSPKLEDEQTFVSMTEVPMQTVLIVVIWSAVFGVALAVVAFYLNQWPSQTSSALARGGTNHLDQMAGEDLNDHVAKSLQKLEQQDH